MDRAFIAGRIGLTGDQRLILPILVATVLACLWSTARHDIVAPAALLGALIPVASAAASTGLAEVVAKAAPPFCGVAPYGAFIVDVRLFGGIMLTTVSDKAAAVAMMSRPPARSPAALKSTPTRS